MYFLYFITCYSSILIASVTSYVLLAGNLDDFKTVAKRFGSEDLARRIEDMVEDRNSGRAFDTDGEQRDSRREHSEAADDQQDSYYEVPTLNNKRRHNQHDRHLLKNTRESNVRNMDHDQPEVAPGLTLDDIVEKVKDRLQQDLNSDFQAKGQINSENTQETETGLRTSSKHQNKKRRKPVATNSENDAQEYDTNPPDNEDREEVYEDLEDSRAHRKPHHKPGGRNPKGGKQQAPKGYSHSQKRGRGGGEEERGKKTRQRKHTERDVSIQDSDNSSAKSRKLKKKIRNTTPTMNERDDRVNNEALAANLESIPSPNNEDASLFEGVNLQKTNDSYEDYVTPAREDVFASDEHSKVPTRERERKKKTTEDDAAEYDYELPKGPLKAKTDSMSYEEKGTISDLKVTLTDPPKKMSKKPKLNTMIPKREFYKMSTPNYYGKLPTVADKYNFDEPIPEADRDHENLKSIGNPHASINGKVVVS